MMGRDLPDRHTKWTPAEIFKEMVEKGMGVFEDRLFIADEDGLEKMISEFELHGSESDIRPEGRIVLIDELPEGLAMPGTEEAPVTPAIAVYAIGAQALLIGQLLAMAIPRSARDDRFDEKIEAERAEDDREREPLPDPESVDIDEELRKLLGGEK